MIYELATNKDIQAVYDVVQHTIKTIYPKYYPQEVVKFFCEHHNWDAILKDIEAQISDKYDKAYLDASLPAAALYEKLGFSTIKHERHPVENEVILAYEIMEKELYKGATDIDSDGRKFIPKMNSENGEA